jgi:hypothetical protein
MAKLKAQTITPLNVTGINNKAKGADDRRRNWLKALVLMFGLVLIIIGGGVLLHFLSKNPDQPQKTIELIPKAQLESQQKRAVVPGNLSSDTKIAEPTPEPALDSEQKQAQTPGNPPPESSDPALLGQKKIAAEQKLAQYVALKNGLDRQGASHWGMETYTRMSGFADQADRQLMDQKYQAAAEKYSEAIADANQLADRTAEALKQLLQDGHQALQAGDGTLAQEKFRVALMIEPASQVARRGLQSAKTIETVTQLIAAGKAHELDSKLTLARADYQKALELDPDSKEARAASNRVKTKIKAQQFQQLLSAGLSAYHNNDLRLARTKLLKAKALKPDSREVQDALMQVDAAIRLSQIEQLKKKAAASEQTEDWPLALNSYLQILKIDPNVQFAVQGKKRTLQRIQITKRIHFFLDTPGVLEKDNQLENASRLMQAVSEVEPKGPKLLAQISKLEQLVTDAQTPVRITIESDSLTDVAVYKVGKLGRFAVRQLDLKPGTYTVVGARDGYKDIRQKVVIKAGQQPLRITIKCTAKI